MNSENIEKAKKAIKFWENNWKSLCIILMGLPWSGKSYVAHYLNKKYGFTLLSGENITQALFGTEKCWKKNN